MGRRILALLVVVTFFVPPNISFAFSGSEALISIALSYYSRGYYQEALHEFSKVLLIEPDNEQALQYVQAIREKETVSRREKVSQALDELEGSEKVSKEEARSILVNRELEKKSVARRPKVRERSESPIRVSGEVQVAAGVRAPGEGIWKEANGDLNERNFRVVFGEAKYNTFDPAIFDRVRVNVDAKNLEMVGLDNVSAHVNVTIDPWSFTGKSEKFTLTGDGGDSAEFELKYWSNTSRTINEIVPTLSNGDAMALPEIKVIDGVTTPTSVTTTFLNIFDIPAKNIDREFLPIREFWLDYNDEPYKIRFFPIAYQDQALTSDDPLMLSNRHTWWEESPWLAEWKPGNLNTGASPDDFSKGVWDDSLAFFTRDSDGLRLTALRGATFEYDGVDLDMKSTVASPKSLWNDYGDFTTYASATRLKYDLLYNFGLGFTGITHFGYKSKELDGTNYAVSADTKFEPFLGTKLLAQAATSQATFDKTVDTFTSERRGNAYFLAWENRFPADDIYEQDFNAVRKKDTEAGFLKTRLRAARLDRNFVSSLASFRQTRDDEFWSRHISFRKHPLYLYTGLSQPMRFDDIRPFAIGDGLDSGRDVVGIRMEGNAKFFSRDLGGLFDVRNVHDVNGGFIENVARIEVAYGVTDKLTAKFLGIRHDLPDTEEDLDPFIFDPVTGKPLVNEAIEAGLDPSLRTFSAGFEYRFSDQFAFNSVFEHTNDSTVATDNYPRGLFNSSSFTTLMEDGKVYREPIPFLYSQTGFDLPPFDYFNIYKFGFSFRPAEQLEFYLDFAFNENKKAGQIDDNMNHYGLEIAYVPMPKLSFIFKYTYSRWIDMTLLNLSGEQVYDWHHNFFIDSRYRLGQDSEFILQYGAGGVTPLGSSTYDPFGGSLAVLDTQHIVRLYFRKRF